MKNSARDNIINEAKRLFSISGYNNTSMKQIAESASVNEVTIYRNFGTKEKLFQEITNKYIEDIDIIDRVQEIKESSIEEVIHHIATWFIKYCFENEVIYKIQLKMDQDTDGFVKLKLTKNFIEATEKYLVFLNSTYDRNYKAYEYATSFVSSMLGIFTVYALDSEYLKGEKVKDVIDVQVIAFINLLNKTT